MIVSRSSARVRIDSYVRSHRFLLLIRHFCTKATGLSTTSDLDFGLGGLLALLAVPGAFTSILLMNKYSSLLQFLRGQPDFNPYLSSLSDEYFFIVYSMAVTGLITLLRWDQLLPDARDFANLAPLSLSLRKVFIANVIALGALAALFAVDINLVSSVIFPFIVTLSFNSFPALREYIFAHVLATLGMSAFTFLALVAMRGVLMALLPEKLYRRAGLLLRTVLLVLLTGTLISVFLVPLSFLQVNYASLRAMAWWPPLWFLSLFESHVGPLRSHSPLGALPAWRALAGAGFLTVGAFALSYKRYFLKIPERQSGLARLSESSRRPRHSTLSIFRPMLRPGLETACFQFVLRTLVRSETHLLFVGLWAGIGGLLTLQELRTVPLAAGQSVSQALLVAPLTFAVLSLGGIRFVFDFPSSVHANWVFRLIAPDGPDLIRSACRKLLLFAGLLPLFLIWFPIAAQKTGWRSAGLYLFFHVLFIALTIELLLWKFQKAPFTCSFTPSRDRLLKMIVGLLLVLVLVLPFLSRIEARANGHPLTLLLLVAALVGAYLWIRRSGSSGSQTLLYEDGGIEPLVLLRLNAE